MENNNLTPKQIQYLELLAKNKGDMPQTLKQLGIEMDVFFRWRRDEVFDHKHRLVMADIRSQLQSEIAVLSDLRRAQIIKEGVKYETTVTTTKLDSRGKLSTTSKTTVKKSPPPSSFLVQEKMRLLEALNLLIKENILPFKLARVLVARCNQFEGDFHNIFSKECPELFEDLDEQENILMATIKASIFG